MKERDALPDQNEPPEDVASLYSWANLHGAKYRDFSASRAQMREKARQRLEKVIEEERIRARQSTPAQRAADAARAEEEAARKAAQETAGQAAQRDQAAQSAAQKAQAAQHPSQQSAWLQAWRDRFRTPPAAAPPAAPPSTERQPFDASLTSFAAAPPSRPAPAAPSQEEVHTPPPTPWGAPDAQENANRPAWLMPETAEPVAQPTLPRSPDDTLQGSRERISSRWFALQSIFEGDAPPVQAQPAPVASRAPVMGVFSLAGGVGKTSLVATLGRVLSARGERVLLVDTAAYGLLPFFFGARDQRPGLLRTFSPPAASGDAAIQMITLDPETFGPEVAGQEPLTAEIAKHGRGLSRIIIDLATASGATTRRIMRMAPHILVPLVPDMSSVVSVSSIDAFFDHTNAASGKSSLPHYVLNQFDASLPLHLDVREVLREQLGDRLLPFALRRAPALSEALAEGMTVVDYAPNSAVAEDFASLAGWVKSLSAPAITSFRGVRWSER